MRALLFTISLMFGLSSFELSSKTLADEIYAKEVQKATGTGNKSYRTKGKQDTKKPGSAPKEKQKKRVKGDGSSQKDTTENGDEKDANPDENTGLSDALTPITHDELSAVTHQTPEFQEWEIRPMTLDEKALTDVEIQMVKDHYKTHEQDKIIRIHSSGSQ